MPRRLLILGVVGLIAYAVFFSAPVVVSQELHRLMRPLWQASNAVHDSVVNCWNHYLAIVGAAKENEVLRQRVAALETQTVHLQEITKEPPSSEGIRARVIAYNPIATVRTVLLDRGWADGIKIDQRVMTESGLVGRVRQVSDRTATVLLITDPASSLDVLDERSRVRGVVTGHFRNTTLGRGVYLTQMEYLNHDSDIQEGDLLISSGMDGVYPKGLPVGKVQEVRRDSFGLFEEAVVVPLADLDRLETVVVR